MRNKLSFPEQAKIKRENRRDMIATCIAVPWQLVLFLTGMMLLTKQWEQFGVLFLALILLSIALYFTWFRYLEKGVKQQAKDVS